MERLIKINRFREIDEKHEQEIKRERESRFVESSREHLSSPHPNHLLAVKRACLVVLREILTRVVVFSASLNFYLDPKGKFIDQLGKTLIWLERNSVDYHFKVETIICFRLIYGSHMEKVIS